MPWLARNTCPLPVTSMATTPSAVTAFLIILDSPPDPRFLKAASPW